MSNIDAVVFDIGLGADFTGTIYDKADLHPENIAAATADEARP